MQNLKTALLQCPIAWEQPLDNREQIATALNALQDDTALVVLPEMFTTGFSMNAVANAEAPGGPTEQWMQQLAASHDCAIAGSIATRTDQGVSNRLLFATPERVHYYDKRHLFRMAGEHQRYRGGSDRVVVPWRGWRINLQICYDLRFPVFSRNRGDYDLTLFVANWPAKRSQHWRTLLQARAIENQAAVVGVNRIGSDASGIDYRGDSLAVAADGKMVLDMSNDSGLGYATFDGAAQLTYREKFPCHLDADSFALLE